MTNHTYIELYDTANNTQKILCAKNRATFDIECVLFILTINTQNALTSCSQTQSVATTTIILRFPTSSRNGQDCIFRNFAGEILFCCGDTGFIKCSRIARNTVVNTFELEFPGSNSKLSFFSEMKKKKKMKRII